MKWFLVVLVFFLTPTLLLAQTPTTTPPPAETGWATTVALDREVARLRVRVADLAARAERTDAAGVAAVQNDCTALAVAVAGLMTSPASRRGSSSRPAALSAADRAVLEGLQRQLVDVQASLRRVATSADVDGVAAAIAKLEADYGQDWRNAAKRGSDLCGLFGDQLVEATTPQAAAALARSLDTCLRQASIISDEAMVEFVRGGGVLETNGMVFAPLGDTTSFGDESFRLSTAQKVGIIGGSSVAAALAVWAPLYAEDVDPRTQGLAAAGTFLGTAVVGAVIALLVD